LLSTQRSKFLTTDLTPHAQSAVDRDDPTGGHDKARAGQLRQELVDWAKGKVASWGTSDPARPESAPGTAFDRGQSPGGGRPLELARLDRSWPSPDAIPVEEPEPPPSEAPDRSTHRSAPALQIHNRYLVAETAEGVTIIDQHALHERILYEHLRERVLSEAIETQNLLVPEPVDLSPTESAAVLEHREVLAKLGMKIEPFGGDTVLVAGYPAMLANMNPVEVLRGLLERLLSSTQQPDGRDLLDELLHAIACRAAVKAGDRLAPEEIATLLEQRHLVDAPHHCPHGRPAALVFTREELDKQFKRG
jgi:DNA mismatch repair protein MutL